jgi:arsenate reductase
MTEASITDRRRPIRVLFVCSHNSARSQMAEALLKRKGGDDFEVYSAGTEPGTVRPMTLRVLEEAGLETSGLRAKAVSEFFGQAFDYVITVCDQAREACPVFPGAGDSLHWGYDDPSEATGTDEERLAVFRRVFLEISLRLEQFVPIALREHGRSPIPAAT